MRTARQAARLLRRDFGAHKVVLFGSLAAAERFLPWSDIDLAAWGIPAEQYFRAVAAVTGLSAEFKIDLVDPADCKPGLAAAIEHEGVELE